MLPEIRETRIDSMAVSDTGLVEILGRVIWSDSHAAPAVGASLKLTKRDTAESRLWPGSLTTKSGETTFRFEINPGSDMHHGTEVTFDAYLLLANEDGEADMRLAWPHIFSSWAPYPTVYGNLSLKKTN